MNSDRYDLQRFVDAQRGIYAQVMRELRQGRKQTHWMWFVFPQIQGLGHSDMARRYAISSIEEARAYLQHAVLGPRLNECTRLVIAQEGWSIEEILGHPDYLKFQSSMTLFASAAADPSPFTEALAKYFGSVMDRHTIERL
ncbi:MAG: DUF1810 domain-containing protein [Steroidobacteraceae bacterium]|jgi:uncharacterized protein (DUF1810 family)